MKTTVHRRNPKEFDYVQWFFILYSTFPRDFSREIRAQIDTCLHREYKPRDKDKCHFAHGLMSEDTKTVR